MRTLVVRSAALTAEDRRRCLWQLPRAYGFLAERGDPGTRLAVPLGNGRDVSESSAVDKNDARAARSGPEELEGGSASRWSRGRGEIVVRIQLRREGNRFQ